MRKVLMHLSSVAYAAAVFATSSYGQVLSWPGAPTDLVQIQIGMDGGAGWAYGSRGPASQLPISFLVRTTKAPAASAIQGSIALRGMTYRLAVDPAPLALPPTCPPGTTVPPSGVGLGSGNTPLPCLYVPPPDFCPTFFFRDTVDLYGNSIPVGVRGEPGVLVPKGGRLRICVDLQFEAGTDSATGLVRTRSQSTFTEFDLRASAGGGRYQNYREAFLRTNLLASGFVPGAVALKQFDPVRDNRDLLHHSMTVRAPTAGGGLDQGRVYIPWLKVGADNALNAPPVPDGVVFGGDENPLLRAGLGMTVFSLEYMASGNRTSLLQAAKMLDWMHASEFIDGAGKRTGFLLRTRQPGWGRPHGHFFFASGDEMSGVILGLVHLNDALKSHTAPTTAEQLQDRVWLGQLRTLAERMATHLSQNHYFIVPPASFPRQERQIGWSATYLYEWYLRRAFVHITGRDFPPTMSAAQARQQLLALPWGRQKVNAQGQLEDDGEDKDGMAVLLIANPSASKRAVVAIKGLGAMRYLSTIDDCQDNEPALVLGLEALNPALPIPGVPGPTVKFTVPVKALKVLRPTLFPQGIKFPYFNFYLFHFFQAGAIPPASGADAVTLAQIKSEMDKLLRGLIVANPTAFTTIDINDVGLVGLDSFPFRDVASAAVLGSICLVTATLGFPACPPPGSVKITAIEAKVGDCIADNHMYAAALHRKFIGGSPFQSAIDGAAAAWQEFAPVASIPGGLISTHNSGNRLGAVFFWEHGPQISPDTGLPRRLMPSDQTEHIPPEMIDAQKSRGLDVLRVGAGLDFMLPVAMLLKSGTGNTALDDDSRAGARSRRAPPTPLVACTTDPLRAEQTTTGDEGQDVPFSNCRTPAPPDWLVDAVDSSEPDDAAQPASIACGTDHTFSISRSTYYSRQVTTRRAPYPFRLYKSSGIFVATGDARADARAHKRLMQGLGKSPYKPVWNTDDVDYFSASCDATRPLRVRANFALTGGYQRLVVDGTEHVPTGAMVDVTVPAGARHLIKVTGDRGSYGLRVDAN